MMARAEEHEVRRGAADLGAGEHEAKMLRLDVLPAGGQAVVGCHAESGLVAAEALVDACLHVRSHLVHCVARIVGRSAKPYYGCVGPPAQSGSKPKRQHTLAGYDSDTLGRRPPVPLEAQGSMSGSEKDHGGVTVNHKQQLPRLRRIEGQVRGIQQMIDTERYCVDVAHQIDAVIAALRRVQSDMIRDHMHGLVQASVASNLSQEERQRLADEIGSLIGRIV
jgi:DNA-binding FrmR family transcriptional regulator